MGRRLILYHVSNYADIFRSRVYL